MSHPLGELGVTHRIHLWLAGKRVVHFLFAIIKLFSLALTAAALLSEMSNSAFSDEVGHFECKFKVDGDVAHNGSMDRSMEE